MPGENEYDDVEKNFFLIVDMGWNFNSIDNFVRKIKKILTFLVLMRPASFVALIINRSSLGGGTLLFSSR